MTILIQLALLWASKEWRQLASMLIIWPLSLGGAVATATSRGPLEFLATRPLRRARLLRATVVPWFVLGLLPALLVFLRERSSVPVPGLEAHEVSSHLALASLAIMFFIGAQPARTGHLDGVAIVSLVTPMALVCWITASHLVETTTRRPLPTLPLWALAACALAGGAVWYRRSLRRALALD